MPLSPNLNQAVTRELPPCGSPNCFLAEAPQALLLPPAGTKLLLKPLLLLLLQQLLHLPSTLLPAVEGVAAAAAAMEQAWNSNAIFPDPMFLLQQNLLLLLLLFLFLLLPWIHFAPNYTNPSPQKSLTWLSVGGNPPRLLLDPLPPIIPSTLQLHRNHWDPHPHPLGTYWLSSRVVLVSI